MKPVCFREKIICLYSPNELQIFFMKAFNVLFKLFAFSTKLFTKCVKRNATHVQAIFS